MGSEHQDAPLTSNRTSPAPAEGSMRAIVQDAYGSLEVFVWLIKIPEVADDQVLVRVHAAGMDRGTWHLMAEAIPAPPRLGIPQAEEPSTRARSCWYGRGSRFGRDQILPW